MGYSAQLMGLQNLMRPARHARSSTHRQQPPSWHVNAQSFPPTMLVTSVPSPRRQFRPHLVECIFYGSHLVESNRCAGISLDATLSMARFKVAAKAFRQYFGRHKNITDLYYRKHSIHFLFHSIISGSFLKTADNICNIKHHKKESPPDFIYTMLPQIAVGPREMMVAKPSCTVGRQR